VRVAKPSQSPLEMLFWACAGEVHRATAIRVAEIR